jgi:hypothetical protein
MVADKFNRLLIVPGRYRFAVRERIRRGLPIYGSGGGYAASVPTDAVQEEPSTAPSKPPPKPKTPMEKAYETLGLQDQTTNLKRVKKAYRKAALRTHPDTGGSAEAFREVQAAYDMILQGINTG